MSRSEDERALGSLLARMQDAWDSSDADAYARCFAPTADYVAFDGTRYRGREQIAQSHRALFDFMRGTRLKSLSIEMRFVHNDSAVVVATGAALLPWQKDIGKGRLSINSSFVARQSDGTWLIEAFQNTRVAPKPIPEGLLGALIKGAMRLLSA
jgi:uncharacterized protein (TIGR02246 family)